MSPWLCVCGVWRSFILKNPRHYVRFVFFQGPQNFSTMTLSKNSQESATVPNFSDLIRMQRQRQLQQESRSSAPGSNAESGCLLRSSTAAPRGSHRTSRSMDNLRSILRLAVAVFDESDDESEDSAISSGCDSNSQP
jgi:hypothetical protein